MLRTSKRRRLELALIVTLGGGTTFQVLAGCTELFGNAGGAALDFCFLLDCRNGFFGGLAQPCDAQAGFTLFIDCPNLTPPFGGSIAPPPTQATGGGNQAGGGVGGAVGGGAAPAGGAAPGGNQGATRGGFGPPIVTPGAGGGAAGSGGVAT